MALPAVGDPEVVATTARLCLRHAAQSDAPFVLEILNEPGWLRYIGDRGVRNLDDARQYIRERFQAGYAQDGYGMYVVERSGEPGPVGLCGLVNRDWLPAPDIGFAMLARVAGQGLGSEAAAAVLELARTRFSLERLVAVTAPDNAPSRRLLRKLGFECQSEKHPTPENKFLCLYSRDLVRAMSPAEVAGSYDQIAERWTAPGFDASNGISAHQRALAFLEPPSRDFPALDVGCGANGRIIDTLLTAGLDVEGLDLSERMLELARARHPEITFHHADICEWQPPRHYAFISAWDSLWHAPLADQPKVLRRLLGALSPGGVIIFTSGGLDRPGETRDEAMGVPMYHATPGIPALLDIIDKSGCTCRHLEYDQWPELHIFVIAQKIPNP